MNKHLTGLIFFLAFSGVVIADIKTAKKEYSRQHYKSALKLFSEYSQRNPADGESWLYQGYIYEHLKNFPKSIEMFKKAADSNLEKKDKITAYVKILIYYQYYKDWTNTAAYANKLLKLNPGNPSAEKALAAANESGYLSGSNEQAPSKDDPEGLIKYYENMLARFPGNQKVLWELSLLYSDQGYYSKAEYTLDALTAADGSNRNYLYKSGIIKIKLNKYKEGIVLLSRAVEKSSGDEKNDDDLRYYSFFNRANAWYYLGETDNSEADYKKAYAFKKSPTVILGLERIYYDKKDCKNIIRFAGEYLLLKPSHNESLMYQLYCNLKQNRDAPPADVKRVADNLKKKYNPLASSPERIHDIIMTMARYYTDKNQFDEAIVFYTAVDRTRNTASEYNFYRGKSHLYLGQNREAISYLEKVTNSASAGFLCAKAAAGLNDMNLAKKYILGAVALKPEYWSNVEKEESFQKWVKESEDFREFVQYKGNPPPKIIEPEAETPEPDVEVKSEVSE